MKGSGIWIAEETGTEIEGGTTEIEETTTEEMKGGKDGAIEGEMIEIIVMNYGVIGESTGNAKALVQFKQKAVWVKSQNQIWWDTVFVRILVYWCWINYIFRDRQRERERRRDREENDRRRDDRRNDGDREKRHGDGRDRNDR